MKASVGCLVFGFSVMVAASSAGASALNCAGNYLGYNFTLAGQTKGSQVVGNVAVNIGQGGRILKQANLSPVSSSVQPGVSIQLSLASADGTGTLNVSYGGGAYTGRLVANTQYGTFRVPVTCQLAGSIRRRRMIENDFQSSLPNAAAEVAEEIF